MTELARAEVVIGGDDSPLQKTLSGAQGRMQKAGKRMQAIGKSLTAKVTLPLAAVGAASVKAFADFDQAMTQSVSIMGDVSDEMKGNMSEAAREVAKTTQFSAKQAAESFFFLASAGLDAEQSIAALPKVAAFAQAGQFDMATATDLLTDAQSALGLSVDDTAENMRNMARVSDVLVKANTLANASVEQFAESLTNKAATALRNVNKDIEEGVAVLAVYADQGIKGRLAGEFLSRTLRITAQAANENTEEFKKLGLVDVEGNLASFADISQILTQELAGLSDVQKAARLEQLGFMAEAQEAIKPLLGSAQAIREFGDGLKNAGGITEEVADKQLDTFSAQLGIAKDNVIDAGIEIGGTLAPAVITLADVLAGLARAFSSLGPATQGFIVAMAAGAAAAGPVLTVVGKLTTAFPLLVKAVGALGTAGTVGLVVAAFASVVAAGSAIIENWGVLKFETKRLVKFLRDKLVDGFGAIVDKVRDKVGAVTGAFGGMFDTVVGNSIVPDMISRIDEEFAKLQSVMGDASEDATGRVESAFEDMLDTVETVVSRVNDLVFAGFAPTNLPSFGLFRDQALGLADVESNAASLESQLTDSTQAANLFAGALPGRDDPNSVPAIFRDAVGHLNRFNVALREAGETGREATEKISAGMERSIERTRDLQNGIQNGIVRTITSAIPAFEGVNSVLEKIGQTLFNVLMQALTQVAIRALFLKAILSGLLPGFLGGVGRPSIDIAGAGQAFEPLSMIGRAHGGPVSPNRSFLVGERGPELFVPSSAGNIVPNNQMGNGDAGGVASAILSRLGPPPKPQSPREVRHDSWWREAFAALDQDNRERS